MLPQAVKIELLGMPEAVEKSSRPKYYCKNSEHQVVTGMRAHNNKRIATSASLREHAPPSDFGPLSHMLPGQLPLALGSATIRPWPAQSRDSCVTLSTTEESHANLGPWPLLPVIPV